MIRGPAPCEVFVPRAEALGYPILIYNNISPGELNFFIITLFLEF